MVYPISRWDIKVKGLVWASTPLSPDSMSQWKWDAVLKYQISTTSVDIKIIWKLDAEQSILILYTWVHEVIITHTLDKKSGSPFLLTPRCNQNAFFLSFDIKMYECTSTCSFTLRLKIRYDIQRCKSAKSVKSALDLGT